MSLAWILRFVTLALSGLGSALAADSPPATPAGPKASPFMPPANAPSATTSPDSGETLEFAGISSVGNRTDYIVFDRAAKKSHWVAMGEPRNGIAVVSHDPRRDILTLTVNGVQKQLPLRKAAASANRPPAPAIMTMAQSTIPLPTDTSTTNIPPPVQPAPPQPVAGTQPEPSSANVTPGQEAVVKQETEARMLVSDLLEIGMAQRRAYEEAQRRSGSGSPTDVQSEPPKQP